MAYLIAATDFTDVANNAVHYACQLAQDLHASVQLVHSFMVPVSFGDNPMPVIPVDEGREIAEERMNQHLAELRAQYPGLSISGQISFGDIVDSLDDLTEDTKPLMIIIGNSGTDDSFLWMGSNVLSVMRHLRLPVLAIPLGFQYKQPRRICYATDYKKIDKQLLEDLVQFIRTTQAKLHILHVSAEANGNIPETPDAHLLQHTLQPVVPEYHYLHSEKAEDGIHEFINTHAIDILIVVPHKQSFWESLFHKSLTKAMVKSCHIPVAAFHES